MNITLSNSDVEKAIVSYIAEQGINVDGKTVSVTLTTKRKGMGSTAEVSIEDQSNVVDLSDETPPIGGDSLFGGNEV